MIFLALGTQLPFDRLTRAMDDWCARTPDHGVLGQIADLGPHNHRPVHYQWHERMAPGDFEDAFARADFVVAHAGMGVIITALTMGKPIVIMPRRADLKEHRNEHQRATAARFGRRPGVQVIESPQALHAALDALHGGGGAAAVAAAADRADPTFTDALRDWILTGRPPKGGGA
jgi:UDP-N-acetylglucosamine transferase subunit ALG13